MSSANCSKTGHLVLVLFFISFLKERVYTHTVGDGLSSHRVGTMDQTQLIWLDGEHSCLLVISLALVLIFITWFLESVKTLSCVY